MRVEGQLMETSYCSHNSPVCKIITYFDSPVCHFIPLPTFSPISLHFLPNVASTPAAKTFSTDSERSVDSSISKGMNDTLDEVEEESDSDDDEENMSKEEAQRHQMEKREKVG